MKMKEITNEINEQIKELKAIMMKAMCMEDVFMDMDPQAISCIQTSLKLIDSCCELMTEYANILESQDKKLDRVLEKLEEKV